MKRSLLTQIKNEWRDNLWLVVALTVVTGLIWGASILFYRTIKPTLSPRGFDYKNVYTLNLKQVPKTSPYFTEMADGEYTNAYYNDFKTLIERLRNNPNVEKVAFHWNALPYSMNFNGNNLSRIDVKDSISYNGNVRSGSPDIVSVLGYESVTGKTQEQLSEILRRGELLLGDSWTYKEAGRNVMDLLGKTVILNNDSSQTYRVGDIIQNVRRMDYEGSWGGTIVVPLSEDTPWGNIAIKIRDGHDNRFKEDFKNNKELRHQRNVYLSDLTRLADTREAIQRSVATTQHMLVCLMVFFLLTIFLGLLGTFWFRIQQRVGEIAIRKVSGATKADIFRRVIGEGMILLLTASLLMSVLIWPFAKAFTGMLDATYLEMFIFEFIAIALVALGIVMSLWYPAARAMRIEPAIALKSE